jgi:hypothetical protein
MERRTGFEPATSRVANEVTAIFTTDHGTGLAGNTATTVVAPEGLPCATK